MTAADIGMVTGLPTVPAPVVPTTDAGEAPVPAWRAHAVVLTVTVAADLLVVALAFLMTGQTSARDWATLPCWPAVLAFGGLYGPGGVRADRFRRLAVGVAFSALASAAVVKLLGTAPQRDNVAALAALALAGIWLERIGVHRLLAGFAPVVGLEQKLVVVGTNDEARALVRSLKRGVRPGTRLIGYVGPAPDGHLDGVPVLGDYDALEEILSAHRVASAVVAATSLGTGSLADVTARLQAAGVATSISVGLPAVAATRVAIDSLDGYAMLRVRPHKLSIGQKALKRAVDLIGASLALILTAPLMAAIAVAVRLTSGPAVIFSQVRVGEGGRPFTIHKIRTMVPGADRLVVDLRGLNQADGALFKLFDDPRVTPVGRFLRRYGLDELPQLWNVVKGDMSLVGPRPPLPHETERYDEWVRGRLEVKPGITGLWQVKGRHELGWDDYVRYDLFYVENWSLAMDLEVILRTVPALVAHRGAY